MMFGGKKESKGERLGINGGLREGLYNNVVTFLYTI